jgi:Protein of unknown function (DUF1552)
MERAARGSAEGEMRAYRVTRRAFLAGVGGAWGLDVLLRNVEAAAAGTPPPPRFVLAFWPRGTLAKSFQPSTTGFDYVTSPILTPFELAGLRQDMTVFSGFSDGHLRAPSGGGAEAGTVYTTTGCNSEGTRMNGGEGDDAVAGGPSFDQIFLRQVPLLSGAGVPSVNVACEARVDSFETSSRCLSYDYQTRPVLSRSGEITEHVPLMPELSPARLYARLFSSFMPGGATPSNQVSALTALALRKSVLDSALVELRELKRLAPAAESEKIDAHAEAIRSLERRLSTPEGDACVAPLAPAAELEARSGERAYTDPVTDDLPRWLAVFEAHQTVLTAALQCDLTRVATFQLAPGTGLVGFRGMWPGDADRVVLHREALNSSLVLRGGAAQDPNGLSGADRENYEFLVNVQTWYNARLASWLKRLKESRDVFGASLLDYTVVPFVTEVAQPNNSRSPKPACLFGGGKLGLKHGSYQQFERPRPQVDLYLTCAQALLGRKSPLDSFQGERFVEDNPAAAPIDGLWETPL